MAPSLCLNPASEYAREYSVIDPLRSLMACKLAKFANDARARDSHKFPSVYSGAGAVGIA